MLPAKCETFEPDPKILRAANKVWKKSRELFWQSCKLADSLPDDVQFEVKKGTKKQQETLKQSKKLRRFSDLAEAKYQRLVFPEWLMKIHTYLQGKTGTLYDVVYPSKHCMRRQIGNVWDCFAISGDGLYIMGFQIISLEGDGKVRFLDVGRERRTAPFPTWDWESILHNEKGFGCELTFPELFSFIQKCKGTEEAKRTSIGL